MRPGTPNAPRRGVAPTPAGPGSTVAMAGAVDLAALKARSDAAARAAESPPPAAGSYVVEVSEASFQAEVLDRSFQVPVLLDLWADWCQPCKQLSPVLEKLANADAGSWVLAKIDIDANPRIAQALQVQSIPTVFAVIGGQLVPGFQGALPEAQLREFVDAVLNAGREAGLTGVGAGPGAAAEEFDAEPHLPPAAPEAPDDPRFAAAEQAVEVGDYDGAARHYQAIVDQEPGNTEAVFALGQVRLLQRVDKLDRSVAGRADTDPADVEAQLAAADLGFVSNDIDGALRRLLATVARTSGADRDRVRTRLLEYFDLLGPDDPRVPGARRELARALF